MLVGDDSDIILELLHSHHLRLGSYLKFPHTCGLRVEELLDVLWLCSGLDRVLLGRGRLASSRGRLFLGHGGLLLRLLRLLLGRLHHPLGTLELYGELWHLLPPPACLMDQPGFDVEALL